MKPLERILVILKSTVPVLIIVVGISCSNQDSQTSMSEQNQSGGQHSHSETDDHDDHDHGGHDGQKSSQVTVWDDRFEIFMEHPFIVANTPTEFITHITDRVQIQPLRKGPVSFILTDLSQGSVKKHVEPSPARDGIFIPKLTFPQPGEWQMTSVVVVNEIQYDVE